MSSEAGALVRVLWVRVYEGEHLIAEGSLGCVSGLVALEERARDAEVGRGARVDLLVGAGDRGHGEGLGLP